MIQRAEVAGIKLHLAEQGGGPGTRGLIKWQAESASAGNCRGGETLGYSSQTQADYVLTSNGPWGWISRGREI